MTTPRTYSEGCERARRAEALSKDCDRMDLAEECDGWDDDEDGQEALLVGVKLGLRLADMRELPEYAGRTLRLFWVAPDEADDVRYYFIAADEDDLCERVRGI